jgi:hypothetical protein
MEPPMSEPEAKRASRIEIANAVVIAIAGLIISFAGYQAALWSGEVELNFSRANVLQTESATLQARAEVREAVGVQIFGHWFDAAVRNETEVADKYVARFPPELRDAFRAWIALHPLQNSAAPSSPFTMPQYAIPEATQAIALRAQADASFRRGQAAKRAADTYGQAVTILSTALFFAGISQVFKVGKVRLALLILAALACALGVVRVLTLPIMTLFANAA